MRRLFGAALAALATLFYASAAAAGLVDDCFQNEDATLKLRACSDLFESGRGDAQARAWVLAERGIARWSLADPSGALNDFNEAVALDPNSVDGYLSRGNLYLAARNYDLAVADLERSLSLLGSASYAEADRAAAQAQVEELLNRARDWAETERHWGAYLADIQSRGDYPNWSGPPYDLYRARANTAN